jgi:two-component system, chemotaxis family, protein-glutamate methylesterase/glutaminase
MNPTSKIRMLVAEDSTVDRLALVHILNSDPRLEVIGTARNGREAVDFLSRQSADIVLMDIEMPEMDGLEATRHIMATRPLPIVICSGHVSPQRQSMMFDSLEAGAVACVEKPLSLKHADFDASASNLLKTVKLMSEVKVVHRWPTTKSPVTVPAPARPKKVAFQSSSPRAQIIGIGASTGGPPVLQTILLGLPRDFPAPILIVQHIIRGFIHGLVDWLNQTTGAIVQLAEDGAPALPGHVYIAPDDFHLVIDRNNRLGLTKAPPVNEMRPAVARLFDSLADNCGPAAVGVLLTGMGKDGAHELKRMKLSGATTIAQDKQSSVVHGMPGAAIEIGAADCILPPQMIPGALLTLVTQKSLLGGRPS